MRLVFILGIFLLVTMSCNQNSKRSDAYGNFESVEVLVSSEMQGKLVQYRIQEGDTIKKNDLVGLIDTIQLFLKKEQLIAQKEASDAKITNVMSQINVQEEELKTLMVDKNRIENLLKDNATPVKQLDDVNGKIKVTQSQILSIRTQNESILRDITAIEKQIAQINDQIQRCKIINPIDGTVLEKYTEQSEIVVPGKILYKIADMKNMILRVYISGEQLPHIRLGQKVKVLIDKDRNSDQTIEGTIGWISPQAEFTPKIIQTKEERINLVYAVKVYVVNNGYLKIGMPGEVVFTEK